MSGLRKQWSFAGDMGLNLIMSMRMCRRISKNTEMTAERYMRIIMWTIGRKT
jgi:hypothetical protein